MREYDRELGQIQESLKNLGESLDDHRASFKEFRTEIGTFMKTSEEDRQKIKTDVESVTSTVNAHLDEHDKKERKVYRNVTIVVALIAAIAEAGQFLVFYFRGR